MQARAARVVVLAVIAAAVLTVTAVAGRSHHADPRTAAKALVARLRAERPEAVATIGSGVVARSGRQWLAVARAFRHGYRSPTRVDVYRWSRASWQHEATVQGDELSDLITFRPFALTSSRDPDFAIQGCGAADTNCLSVISDAGGRWRAVPFDYGYGRDVVVNGMPEDHRVLTMVDACSCAGGPTTFLYEAYRNGRFRPVEPPKGPAPCTTFDLGVAAGNGQVPILQFDRVACAAGWGIGVGTGAGFSDGVVGLFSSVEYRGRPRWQALTVDTGTSLPAAPGMYDLPLALLRRLGARLGPDLRPMVAAATLIARLEQHGISWPQQDGIVSAGETDWLVAIVPARARHKAYPPYPVAADIYRWAGGRWRLDGHVAHLPGVLDLAWLGGWMIPVPSPNAGAVTFAAAGVARPVRSVLTNAGGTWHVASR